MVKRKTKFVCQHCGYETAKWMGKCPGCHSWNAMVEETEIVKPHTRALFVHTEGGTTKPVSITTVETTQEPRIDTKFTEFNRVLGGGIVRGSLVLIGGIQVLENRRCCYKFALNLQAMTTPFYIFRGKNR